MIRLDKLKNILKDILKIDQLIKEHSIGIIMIKIENVKEDKF